MREEIKDSKRQRIGYIDRQLNGKITIYDKTNFKIGDIRPEGKKLVAYDKKGFKFAYWDENQDATFDKSFRKISKGNILVELFFQ